MLSQHSPLGGASTSALTQPFQCSELIGDLVAVVVSHEPQLEPFSLHQVQPVISAVWSPVTYPGLLWVTSAKGLWRLKKKNSSAGSVVDGKYVLFFFFPVFVLFPPHFISSLHNSAPRQSAPRAASTVHCSSVKSTKCRAKGRKKKNQNSVIQNFSVTWLDCFQAPLWGGN